jgi:hypothetical protein
LVPLIRVPPRKYSWECVLVARPLPRALVIARRRYDDAAIQ